MKRIYVILLTLLACILVTLGLGVLFLKSGRIQTAAVKFATEELSRNFNTNVSIGSVQYNFPMRITLKDLYIEDQQQDTLLYIKDFYTRFSPLALRSQYLRFPAIELETIRANVYQLPSGEYNYQFLIDAFASRDTSKSAFDMHVELRHIKLADAHLSIDSLDILLPDADLALNHFCLDSLDAEIHSLTSTLNIVTNDNAPLQIENLSAHLIATPTFISLPTLQLELPNSQIDASGVYTSFPVQKNQEPFIAFLHHHADSITVSLNVEHARLVPQDLAYFVPNLSKLDGVITFSAHLLGTVDSLSARDLELFYNDKRIFLGNLDASGLPELDSIKFKANCQDLYVHQPAIQDFLSDLRQKPYYLPAPLLRLGDTHYKGELQGQLREMTLHGAFRTALGVITTDASYTANQDFSDFAINGCIATKHFQLGRLLNNPDFGAVSISVNTDWHLSEEAAPFGKADVVINKFSFRKYTYSDIRFHAELNDLIAKATAAIEDPGLQLSINTQADLREEDKRIEADIILRRFCPNTLQLMTRYPGFDLSGTASLHYYGHDIDHATYAALVKGVQLCIAGDTIRMESLDLKSRWANQHQVLRVRSDYLNADAAGDYAYTSLHTSIFKLVAQHIPSIYPTAFYNKLMTKPSNNVITFNVRAHDLEMLQAMLELPFMLVDSPTFEGIIDEPHQFWNIEARLPELLVGNAEMNNLAFASRNNKERLNLLFSMEMDSTLLDVNANAQKDSMHLQAQLTALPPHNTHGLVDITTHFSHYAGLPLINTYIQPSVVQLGDSIYHIDNSQLTYCVADTSLTIPHFRIYGSNQNILAEGVASPRLDDSIHISLKHIHLGTLMPFLLVEKAFTVAGDLTGWANIYGMFSTPVFEAQVRLDSAIMCGAYVGDAVAEVALDRETKSILIDGNVDKGSHRVAHVDGLAEPTKGRFLIDIFPDSIPIGFINHWTQAFLENIDGTASGRVTVSGEGKKVWVMTRVKAHDAQLTIPFNGCTYHFSDSVFMDSTSIIFPDINLTDDEGNPLYFNGVITHDEYFRNFKLDLSGHCRHTLAFDFPAKPGQFMAGHVYADGDFFLEGPDYDLKFTADARAVGKSNFRISVDGVSSAADNEFITFYDHNKPDTITIQPKRSFIPKRKQAVVNNTPSRFRLSLAVDVDPQTLFQLIINESTGDMIQARGDGSIKFTMDDATDDYKLVGTYTLNGGKMDLTVANLIHREFTIADGSQIIWNGNPEEPILHVAAEYTVVANIRDLFGSETENLVSGRTSIPVTTIVYLSGPLSDPVMRFDLRLPKSDEIVANQIRSVINTDEMMMRQVVYLLVFGRFYTPEYMAQNSGSSQAATNTYAILSSTITGQINNWLSKITNVLTVGFNVRADGTEADDIQEYEAVFQLQPIDQLVINGNFGYRYNDISNQPFFGDLDIEYLLTPNGKFRLKGYTHTVDKYSLRQATMIEGVGFVFKHDFNWKKNNQQTNQVEQ